MPSKNKASAPKIRVECPHCRAAQFESAKAQSTICRQCSEYFEIVRPGDEPTATQTSDSFFRRIGKLVAGEKTVTVQCYNCNAKQTVSNMAKSSLCPSCSHYIDMRDHKISTVFSRTVETQGVVTIGAKADVSSARIVCREAYLYGKLRGQLVCTGETLVKLKGKVFGAITTQHLVLEKRSDVEFARAVKVGSAEIRGKAYARIDADGVVTITKSGCLEGAVHAKSITVEKGGKFSGELYIGKPRMEQQELLPIESPQATGLFADSESAPEPA